MRGNLDQWFSKRSPWPAVSTSSELVRNIDSLTPFWTDSLKNSWGRGSNLGDTVAV